MNQKTSKVEKEFYLRCSYLTLSVLFDKEPKNRVTPPYSDRLIVSVTTSRKKIMFILFQSQKILPLHNLHHHRLRL